MTNDTRSAEQIEHDIQEERAQMSGTINDLQKKFSVEAIVSDLGTMFRGPGSDLGRSISQTVGRNPAAVALVGVGLAWLVLGQGRKSDGPAPSSPIRSSRRKNSSAPDWERSTLPITRQNNTPSREGDRLWFGETESEGEPPLRLQNAIKPHDNASAEDAAGTWGRGADAVVNAVSQAAGSIRDTAADLTEKLSSGTDGFSAEAKARVIAARRSAHDARIASQDAMKRGGRMASNLFEEQPLVIGALAVALGAAMGGILPRSQLEDDTLGANSDRMFAEAQRVFYEEKNKAMAVVNAAAVEAKDAVKDTGTELADHLSDAATRVTNSAKEEATRQGLLTERQS